MVAMERKTSRAEDVSTGFGRVGIGGHDKVSSGEEDQRRVSEGEAEMAEPRGAKEDGQRVRRGPRAVRRGLRLRLRVR